MQVMEARSGQTPLPSTWVKRTLRVVYAGAYGDSVETTAALLDTCPAGPVLSIDGARTLITWPRVILLELVED
jgi:hypothetical protein